MMPVGTSVRLLMSAAAREQLLPRVMAACADGGLRTVEVITLEDAVARQVLDFDGAFISRDVTGTSTKHRIEPALQAVYDLLLAGTRLRWVHIHSAGADRPAFVSLHQRGVAVTTSSGANARVVAATALAGVLALARRFPMLWAQQQQRQWVPLLGAGRLPRDLPGQQATILGWGPIAQELARLLTALGLQVTAVRTRACAPVDGVRMCTYADLSTVLPHTDWLVLACPLTDTTRGLVNAKVLAALPAGAHLVNVARGEVVDETALTQALQRGHLGGAFLDVFHREPLGADSELWGLPQVMVTPHAAGHSDGNEARVAEMFIDNLGRWLRGQPMLNLVTVPAAAGRRSP